MSDSLLWAYCVLPVDRPGPDAVKRVEVDGLAALVRPVPRDEYGAEALRRNLNDLAWLERVARSHESVLEQAMAHATIVPLRICTLYESEESVRHMLESEGDALRDALDFLAGRQEWGVKLLLDPERLAEEARGQRDEPEPEGLGGSGAAYMLRRREERETRALASSLARQLAEEVHTRLGERALGAVTRPPQNRELSGHDGEMVLNAAYLVEAERAGELSELVSELEAEHAELGARLELTGPWPPYNFVPAGTAAHE